jgi:pantothenate kinase type III
MRHASEPPIEIDCLTVDLGNSRLKAVAWRAASAAGYARPGARLWFDSPVTGLRLEALELATDPEAWRRRFAEFQLSAPRRIALSCVAAPEVGAAVAAALRTAFAVPVFDPPPHGLELDLTQPETVGADRLFAARGAAALGRSAVVLDAGTALTVDAVEVGPGMVGRFLGGAIAPGPSLLMRALAAGGARLFEVEPKPGVPALGKATREALLAGIAVGFRGAAFELARRVGLEAGLAKAPRVLCGGAAQFLLEPEPFWPGELLERPDLVHEGLRLSLEACS